MRLARGAVVIASLDDPSGKPRPFVVLRSNAFEGHSLVTLLAFTGTITDTPLLRVAVQPSAGNGLDKPSQAMIDNVRSVRVGRVREVVGQLAGADLRRITSAVAVYLGLADTARPRRRPGPLRKMAWKKGRRPGP